MPELKKKTTKKRPELGVSIKQFEQTDSGLRFTAVASTEAIDRDGEIISLDGWTWNESPYPKLLWAHDSRMPPLGTLDGIRKDPVAGLLIDAEMADKHYEFANTIAGMIPKFVNQGSVGFEPLEWVNPDGSTDQREKGDPFPFPEKGRRYVKQELWEFSLAPVVSQVESFINATRALTDEDGISLFDRIAKMGMLKPTKQAPPPEPKNCKCSEPPTEFDSLCLAMASVLKGYTAETAEALRYGYGFDVAEVEAKWRKIYDHGVEHWNNALDVEPPPFKADWSGEDLYLLEIGVYNFEKRGAVLSRANLERAEKIKALAVAMIKSAQTETGSDD
jgi:hypothetical protein